MESLAENGVSLPVLLAYDLLILLYLIILRLMLNFLQQLGDKHRTQRSIIDVDVHRTMTPQVDSSMQTFDPYSIAIVIAKAGISVIAMAAIIILSIIKLGVPATILLIIIVVISLYALNRYLRSREKPGSVRAEARKFINKAGSMGSIILLSILLVIVLFIMTLLH